MSHFALDPAHSSLEFTVRHLVFSKVRGAFNKFTADWDVDDATNVPTRVSAEIDASSIDTKNTDRDNHLRSADFLDVEKYPTITFQSTKISGAGSDIAIEGDLTIHGVTKRITLKAELDGRGTDPWGNDRISYSATTKFSRKDHGMVWNQALEAGGFAVGDEIDLTLTVQAVKVAAPAAV